MLQSGSTLHHVCHTFPQRLQLCLCRLMCGAFGVEGFEGAGECGEALAVGVAAKVDAFMPDLVCRLLHVVWLVGHDGLTENANSATGAANMMKAAINMSVMASNLSARTSGNDN